MLEGGVHGARALTRVAVPPPPPQSTLGTATMFNKHSVCISDCTLLSVYGKSQS